MVVRYDGFVSELHVSERNCTVHILIFYTYVVGQSLMIKPRLIRDGESDDFDKSLT